MTDSETLADTAAEHKALTTPGPATLEQTGHAAPPVRKRAIVVNQLVKEYHTQIGIRRVIDGITFRVQEGEKIAIFGKNGAGKSTLVRLIGGVEKPTTGFVRRELFLSWPLGFIGGLSPEMSGIDNIRFISRLYDKNFQDVLEIADDFAELGRQLLLPLKTYSSGMNARLAFGLTFAVDFECYLIDEVMSVGDSRFQKKCFEALFVNRGNRAMVMISHDMNIVKTYCSKALVLKGGRGKVFEDLDLAMEIYHSL